MHRPPFGLEMLRALPHSHLIAGKRGAFRFDARTLPTDVQSGHSQRAVRVRAAWSVARSGSHLRCIRVGWRSPHSPAHGLALGGPRDEPSAHARSVTMLSYDLG